MNIFSFLLKFFKKEKSSQDTLDEMWAEKKKSEDVDIAAMIRPGDIKLGEVQTSVNELSETALSKINTEKGNLPWIFTGDILDTLEECGCIKGISDDGKSIIIGSFPGHVNTLPVIRPLTPEIIGRFFPTYNSYRYNDIKLELVDNIIIVKALDSAGSIFYVG